MTEEEYQIVTNLQKYRIILDLLQDCSPTEGLPKGVLEVMTTQTAHTVSSLIEASGIRKRLPSS